MKGTFLFSEEPPWVHILDFTIAQLSGYWWSCLPTLPSLFSCCLAFSFVFFLFLHVPTSWRKQFIWCCSFLSCLPLAEFPKDYAAGPFAGQKNNLIATYFWWMGDRKSVPRSDLQYFFCWGIRVACIYQERLGRLCIQFRRKFVDTTQAENRRTRQEMGD